MKKILFTIVIIILGFVSVFGQTRTVGLFKNDTTKVYKGYTLFAPKQNTMTYLINNEGRIVHKWTASKYAPGQSVYLLENGDLLRTCMTLGQLSSGGGEGGRIERYDWNDNLIWSMDFSTATYMQHHDIRLLPNGNIIMLVIEKKTYAECIAAGFDPSKFQSDIAQKGMMVPDYVVEIQPTLPTGGTVVWEWHTWDHLIQDFDATKLNYGVPKLHPELIDCDGDGRSLPSFWNHMNSIDYNPAFDEIALSVRGNSEVWIIDHSTTTAEAKSHTGGKRGKGGDLIYRWGNPATYGAGTKSDQKYFEQHDVEWVLTGRPGAGNLTCFNNGLGRGAVYSSVDEFTPAVDANGNYSIVSGSAFLPKDFTWTYKGSTTDSLYSENISGAFRLPNGNTIICSGTSGTFIEVTSAGEIVWKYICPVQASGPITQGSIPDSDPARASETMNSVFRVYKYSLDYAAFVGKDLTPGDYVEKYTSGAISISSNPSNGGTTSGAGTYTSGNSVTVIATPNSGYSFTNWTENGTTVSTSSSYTFTISGDRTLVANFTLIQYTLTLSSSPTNGGTTSGAGAFNYGSSVTITATPNSGYKFINWTENGTVISASSSYSFTINNNRTLIANFILVQYILTLSSNPGNGGTTNGAGSYNSGSSVTVKATPISGYKFYNWTENGQEISKNPQYSFVISKDRDLIANFLNVTSIDQLGEQFENFILQQNYPNPFNPTTRIQFSIPKEMLVRLSVYNLLGQEIVILVNRELSAASYSVEFNASGIPDGVYFYKLETGEFMQTKKMILTK